MSLLYKMINPPVKALLKSPFHSLMSNNTLLLEVRGRKSGKALSTPISYHIKDGAAYCFTNKQYAWWRNLSNGQMAAVTIKGQTYQCAPHLELEDQSTKAAELHDFLKAVPRDAPHAGVSLDSNGTPNPEDIQKVVSGLVLLKFPLDKEEAL